MNLLKPITLDTLKQRRKGNGFLKQVDVAAALGLHPQTIKKLERGDFPKLDPARWVVLQEIYGMTIEQFAALQDNLNTSRKAESAHNDRVVSA